MSSKEPKVYQPMITRREQSILYLMAEGYQSQEIANELTLSEKAVRGTQMSLMRKWKASDESSIIDHALEQGWISIYRVLESRFSKRKASPN